jgi:hypothetical protein
MVSQNWGGGGGEGRLPKNGAFSWGTHDTINCIRMKTITDNTNWIEWNFRQNILTNYNGIIHLQCDLRSLLLRELY